jgi:branched-chain amino acid transport system substrate-binding protein
MKNLRWLLGCLVIFVGVARLAAADTAPIGANDIVLGMSTALSGPAADLGTNMRTGVLAALEEANRAGGIQGRKLRLIALDDGYEPARTGPNMRTLIGDSRVLAVVGNVGTPTAVAAVPITIEGKMPFYGAFTGAGVLRKTPPDHYVVNYRASYAQETSAMVDALIEKAHLTPQQIAFFTQRDAYGDAGFVGGIAALKRHGLVDANVIAHVRYERNTVAVEKPLSDLLLLKDPPRAVIMVGAYAPCASFIQLAKQNELDAIFLNVSFVGSESLAKALGSAGDGVIVTQTVPHFESDLPVARQYKSAMAALGSDSTLTFGSMEGYVSTRLLLLALGRNQGPLTREGVIQSLEQLGKVDLGLGAELELSPTQHQASQTVWPTVIHGGKVVPFQWEELSSPSNGIAHD